MMHINIDEAISFLDNHQNAMQKYNQIISLIKEIDVSSELAFQKMYNGFYRVRRGKDWQKSYYDYFESHKNSKEICFEDVLKNMYTATGRIEASFSSKMIASINPDMPIWDSIVLKNMNVDIPKGTAEQRIEKSIMIYDDIMEIYDKYLQTEEAVKYIKRFDTCFPQFSSFSNLKKIDFLSWGTRD